jgi:antitoxin ParD1/3/4
MCRKVRYAHTQRQSNLRGYEDASEVVRAGLRNLEREEQEHAAKLAALRRAIDEGDASGVAAGNVFGRIRKTLKLSASR